VGKFDIGASIKSKCPGAVEGRNMKRNAPKRREERAARKRGRLNISALWDAMGR
jgi:hypothetical protein